MIFFRKLLLSAKSKSRDATNMQKHAGNYERTREDTCDCVSSLSILKYVKIWPFNDKASLCEI